MSDETLDDRQDDGALGDVEAVAGGAQEDCDPTQREEGAPGWLSAALPVLLLVALALINFLLSPFDAMIDEIKTAILFVLLPWGVVGVLVLIGCGRAAPVPAAIWGAFTLFFVVLILSALRSPYLWRVWYMVGWRWSCAAAFVGAAWSFRTERSFSRFVLGYLILGLVVVLFGFFRYFHGLQYLLPVIGTGSSHASEFYNLLNVMNIEPDMSSSILCIDQSGAYYVILTLTGLGAAVGWRRKSKKTAATAAAVALLSAIGASVTNVIHVQLALCVGLLLFAVLIMGGRRRRPASDRSFGLAILSPICVVAGLASFAAAYIHLVRISFGVPFLSIHWSAGMKMFLRSPFLGVGPGGYLIYFPLYCPGDGFEHGVAPVSQSAFSMYVQLLAETGVFGFLAFMSLIAAVVWLAARQIRLNRRDPLHWFQCGLLASVVGFCVEASLFNIDLMTLSAAHFWTVMGLSVSCAVLGLERQRAEEAAPEQKWETPPWQRRAVGLVGVTASAMAALALVAFGVLYYRSSYYYEEGMRSLDYASYGLEDHKLSQAEANRYYQQAIDGFEGALCLWPGRISCYYKEAHVYSQMMKLDKALEAYDKLERYAPGYAEIYRNYGIVYSLLAAQERDLKKRADYARRALECSQRAADTSLKLGVQFELASAYQAAAYIIDAPAEQKERWRCKGWETLYNAAMRRCKLDQERKEQQELRRMAVMDLETAAWDARIKGDESTTSACLSMAADVRLMLAKENGIHDDAVTSGLATRLRETSRLGETPLPSGRAREDNVRLSRELKERK